MLVWVKSMGQLGLGKRNWFSVLLILILLGASYGVSLIERVNRFVYDIAISQFQNKAHESILLVNIDDESISTLGQWPWQRSLHADFAEALVDNPPKVLVYLPYFFDKSLSAESTQLQLVDTVLNDIGVSNEMDVLTSEPWNKLLRESTYLPENRRNDFVAKINNLHSKLSGIKRSLSYSDQDSKLGNKFGALPKVILPAVATFGKAPIQNSLVPEIVSRSAMPISVGEPSFVKDIYSSIKISVPIPEVASNIEAIGHANIILGTDGVLRQNSLVVNHSDNFIPSLSLAVVAANYDLSPKEAVVDPGFGVYLGQKFIPTNLKLQINTTYYDEINSGDTIFPTYSFVNVLNGKINPNILKDKIVIVGETARGLGSRFLLPDNRIMSSPEVLAHSISNILNDEFVVEPQWNLLAQIIAFVIVMLLVLFFISRNQALYSTLVLVLGFVSIFAIQLISLYLKNIWLNLAGPLTLLIFSYFVFTLSRFFRLETVQYKSTIESNENHRILGLTYQGQGQLDLAFDHLRRCEASEDLATLLYMLGLDFERKRQYHKAVAVYEHILRFLPAYKDLEQRIKALNQTESSAVTFTSSESMQTQTIIKDDQIELEKPTLGRYTISKEIGRGGMGVVYLGADPKINRSVALKTLDLNMVAKESENPEETIARFYREAKAVGQLNHRSIVTIYDVGQEKDLAYLAMEFLNGTPLNRFVSEEKRLPIPDVIKIGLACADALDYAHKQNVIHRDIKPSNIIYDPENRSAKITDFGVAHLINNQFTNTNIIVGTLGYMSPEQIRGEQVDGRSDIFSLGATLYQLLSGALAFDTSSIASFSYSVCHDSVSPINELNPEVSDSLSSCIQQSMEKNPDLRFQSGLEMKNKLSSCLSDYAS